MSFNEVTHLRKEGKLKDALEMAKQDLENDQDNEWPKRAIVWVYYAYLKKAQEKNDIKEIVRQIENIKSLNLPDTEKMVFDSVAWSVGKYLFANREVTEPNLVGLFELIKDFSFSKPKDSYSFLLKAFHKHAQNWGLFIEFTEWWGLDNFSPKDYEPFITENGNNVPALVERVYISISKKLLIPPINIDLIYRFIPRIEKLSHEHRNMQYPPYYYAKLLLALGDKEHFMQAFLPFARKKKNDFWVWDLMSEIFEKESQEYFSCLCKSLSCGAPGKFTINVKEKLAVILEMQGRYAEAKREFSDILEARISKGWPLKDKHYNWQQLSWWNNTEPVKSNFSLYNSNKQIAENLLFANVPETLIVVDSVNKEKTIFSFIASKEVSGFTHYAKLKIKPRPGDIYAVRFKDSGKENKSNFYQIFTIVKTDKKPDEEILKIVNGEITIHQGNSFGFVEYIYVPAYVINREQLKSGDKISVMAILSYNRKKKDWGWKTIKLNFLKEQ